MEKEPFDVKITFGDIARAVGDLIVTTVRHLPESGYPSSRQIVERSHQALQLPLSYDSEGNWHNPDGDWDSLRGV